MSMEWFIHSTKCRERVEGTGNRGLWVEKRHLGPKPCTEDGSPALSEGFRECGRGRVGVGGQRRPGSRSRVALPTSVSRAWQAGTQGTGSLSLPQNIWGCIRHNGLVKKIVMEICNREPLSKASLKSLFNPQPGGGDWKLENWETITGPSKWPKFNPICRVEHG